MLSRRLDDLSNIATTLIFLSILAHDRGDFEMARDYLVESLEVSTQLQSPLLMAHSYYWRGRVESACLALEEGEAMFNKCLTSYRQTGNQWGISVAVHGLSLCALNNNMVSRAYQYAIEAIDIPQRMNDRQLVAFFQSTLGDIYLSRPSELWKLNVVPQRYLLQEYVESKIHGYTLSVRSVALGGEFMCMYANLSQRSTSNHGILTYIASGNPFGLIEKDFKTELFNQESWEAEIWFGENEPQYLRHNLYEEEVAKTSLLIPEPFLRTIKDLSIKVERLYEGLDLLNLPKASFEE